MVYNSRQGKGDYMVQMTISAAAIILSRHVHPFAKVIELCSKAKAKFGGSKEAAAWFEAPHPQLEGLKPYEMLLREKGPEKITALLAE
jgi:uncharacterized protein (DUF2384 family)